VRGPSGVYQFYRLLWIGLDLLLPPTCGGCGRTGSRWCLQCQQAVSRLTEPLCEVCGVPVQGRVRQCAHCRASRPEFRALRSWAVFDHPVRPALLRLKYRRDVGLGEALVPQLSQFIASLRWPVDLLAPVPLGQGRLKERGYNQSELIGLPLSLALGLVYVPQALVRTRETRSQVGLSRKDRQDNVHGAFKASLRRVKGRRVLLLDDVATTGATLASCAEALRVAGTQDVFAVAVARARHRHGSVDA
jgi:ComF family protein